MLFLSSNAIMSKNNKKTAVIVKYVLFSLNSTILRNMQIKNVPRLKR